VRIIGGEWRGRRLEVAEVAGLRPSGDRLRETLFNWLGAHVGRSRCLDLFAGTGALGLEAASRGAVAVTLVERDARACAALERALVALGASSRVRLVRTTAAAFLASADTPFDLVFVDPPFADGGQGSVLTRLADGHLSDGARVYVEAPTCQPWPATLPGTLELERERSFGDVTARLLRSGARRPRGSPEMR